MARAIHDLLPFEDILYVGDTARVPYGGRSAETVVGYAKEVCRYLNYRRVKCIVVACNTASAVALEAIRQICSVPVIGVIEPGAGAAAREADGGAVCVMATRATIASGAYERAIHAIDAGIHVVSKATPLLVPLIEEDWIDEDVTMQVLKKYLDTAAVMDCRVVLLGCTHYPLIRHRIEAVATARIVDSANSTARMLRDTLEQRSLDGQEKQQGRLEIVLTDDQRSFLDIARKRLHLEPFALQVVALDSMHELVHGSSPAASSFAEATEDTSV